jgi:hypothetical protein
MRPMMVWCSLQYCTQIFEVLKNIDFHLKIQRGLSFGFYEKCLFTVKIDKKTTFLGCEAYITAQ